MDLGIKELAITSDGEFFEHPEYLRKAEQKLAISMRKDTNMEIKEIKHNLDRIKKSREMWNEFGYVEIDDEAYGDVNYLKRYALAIELQYSCTADDKELVKFLLDQEIESRSNDPYQGYGKPLFILSYLLAKFRDPENIWLFEEAKSANFDTYCGYDSEFLFSAGVEATCAYLDGQEINEEDYPYLFQHKDKLRDFYTEKEIEEFMERMKNEFPEKLEEETITTLLDRAIEFEEYREAERLYRLLEQEEGISTDALYSYAVDLKMYEKAIQFKLAELEDEKSARDQVSLLQNVAKLYYLNGDYIHAYEYAQKWDSLLSEFCSWKETGLGRSITSTWFDLCLRFYNQDNRKLALSCFQKGHETLKEIKNHRYFLVQKASMCCEKVGTPSQQNEYKRLLEEEKKRIDQ